MHHADRYQETDGAPGLLLPVSGEDRDESRGKGHGRKQAEMESEPDQSVPGRSVRRIQRAIGGNTMLFTLQDKYEDPLRYIGSFTTRAAAEDMLRELEEQDRRDNVYENDKYIITRRGICYNSFSKKCGYCTNCICMLTHPDIDCPLVKQRTREICTMGGLESAT